jgi:hypothetical protein
MRMMFNKLINKRRYKLSHNKVSHKNKRKLRRNLSIKSLEMMRASLMSLMIKKNLRAPIEEEAEVDSEEEVAEVAMKKEKKAKLENIEAEVVSPEAESLEVEENTEVEVVNLEEEENAALLEANVAAEVDSVEVMMNSEAEVEEEQDLKLLV